MKEKYFISRNILCITISIAVLLSFVLKEARAADRGKITFVSADSGRWELYTLEDGRDPAPQQLPDSVQDKCTPC